MGTLIRRVPTAGICVRETTVRALLILKCRLLLRVLVREARLALYLRLIAITSSVG